MVHFCSIVPQFFSQRSEMLFHIQIMRPGVLVPINYSHNQANLLTLSYESIKPFIPTAWWKCSLCRSHNTKA